MHLRPFGSTQLQTSELGLGCARIGGIFQQSPRSFLDLLAAAHDHGIRFFDTADMYSQGESEALIGRAFRRRRDRIIIASKAGYCLPTQRRLVARIKPLVRPVIRLLKLKRSALPAAVRGALAQDFSPAYLRTAVEGSLRRLRTDYIDVLQLHSPPLEVVRGGEWLGALESLQRAGKIRYYGVACEDVASGLAALEFSGVASLQVTINLLERDAIEQLLPRARMQGVAVIARECLANGLLVKEAKDLDLKAYCHSSEDEARRTQQLAALRLQAAAQGKALAGYALDYVRGLNDVSVTLIGARTTEQLRGVLRTLH